MELKFPYFFPRIFDCCMKFIVAKVFEVIILNIVFHDMLYFLDWVQIKRKWKPKDNYDSLFS